MSEKAPIERISSFDLLRGVLIEMKERGLAKEDSFGNLVFPVGYGDLKKLHRAYHEIHKKFPDEMNYKFLLRTTPYCENLNETLQLFGVSGSIRWSDDGRPWFKDEQSSNKFLNPNEINNYERVKKVASSIVERLEIN